MAKATNRREFLMLGKSYDPDKHSIAGYYMSEKLDGIRAFWDGGISRGLPTTSVPWASVINPKTGQQKTKIKPFATGLWSRYGNPIAAPDWFLNQLPCCPLDGELWAGHGGFQTVTSVCRKDKAEDAEWRKISYGVFSCPNPFCVFHSGEIKNANFHCTIDSDNIERWIKNRDRDILENFVFLQGKPEFSAEIANLNEWLDPTSETIFMIKQTKLPDNETLAKEAVAEHKRKIIERGGEGLVLRDPHFVWHPKRVPAVLKVKGSLDAEGILVGYTAGRETNKGSKLLGMIGALILDFNGQRLELAGLTDDERTLANSEDIAYATANPGKDLEPGACAKCFCIGDKITFTYRELTNDGIPKEARYFRKR